MNSPFVVEALEQLDAAKASLTEALDVLSPAADDVDVLMLAIAAVDEALLALRGELFTDDEPDE
jgi:hypothetical protein